MKKRSIVAVVLLPFVTLGIYPIYWWVSTKGELNQKGAQIPTAWLLIVPFVSIWWIWKYYQGAEQVTEGRLNGILMFVLDIFVTSLIPMALCQDEYNKLSDTPGLAPPAQSDPGATPVFAPVNSSGDMAVEDVASEPFVPPVAPQTTQDDENKTTNQTPPAVV